MDSLISLLKSLYCCKKNRNIYSAINVIIDIVVVLLCILLVASKILDSSKHSNYISITFILGIFIVFLVILNIHVTYFYMRRTVLEQKGFIYSNTTQNHFNMLQGILRTYEIILGLYIVGAIIYYSIPENIITKSNLYLVIAALLAIIPLRAWVLDPVIIFKEDCIITSKGEYLYSRFDDVKYVKKIYGIKEDAIVFKLYKQDKCVAFDKFYSKDYNELLRRIKG